MARISTHVLDTARGVPAKGVTIELHRVDNGQRRHLKAMITNADGRTDSPLLTGERLETGHYELTFHAGDYLRNSSAAQAGPPFLDDIVVRFVISEPESNYHVPLLLSPFGYSTYRGS